MRYDNNRDEYRNKCLIFAAVISVLFVGITSLLYFTLLTEDPEGFGILLVALVSTGIFLAFQCGGMALNLQKPEMEADSLLKSELVSQWSLNAGAGFGLGFALVMGVGTVLNGELSEALPAIAFGCPLMGAVIGFAAYPIAKLIAPKGFYPWLTYEGFEASCRRSKERWARIQANVAQSNARAKQQEERLREAEARVRYDSPSESAEYRGQIDINHCGMCTFANGVVYRGNSMTVVGKYDDGRVYTVPYEQEEFAPLLHSVTDVGTYDRYTEVTERKFCDCKKQIVGRVLRSGEVQRAEHPDTGFDLFDAVAGEKYHTVGYYSGSSEGAAAAALLMLMGK